MAYSLPLAKKVAKAGWKVKIQDKESRESPHVTIWFKGRHKWRINLRNGTFMDEGSRKEIDEEVREAVEANWQLLRAEWDRMYGDVNPISSEDPGDV